MPAELLDDRAVHRLADPHQAEADALLGDELPDRQARSRSARRPTIASATRGCLRECRGQREAAGQERGDEVEEADPEEPDEALDARG